MEGMLSLLMCFDEQCSDFVNKVNFLDEHSCNRRAYKSKVFKVHIKFDCSQVKITAEYPKEIEPFCGFVIDDVTTI